MSKRTLFSATLIVLWSWTAFSATRLDPLPYYPEEFYQKLESGLRDHDLKTELFQILNSAHITGGKHDTLKTTCEGSTRNCFRHKILGYRPARQILFGELHLQRVNDGYAIKDEYCEVVATAKDFQQNPPGPGQIPDSSVLNAEHTWPQSRFTRRFPTDMQKSDLNILFPVLSRANSARGNIEFGDVISQTSSPCPKAKRGVSSRGETTFEVPDDHKGRVARAIFYFSVRYKTAVSNNEEEALRRWHQEAPVDESERLRHETIFSKQKVRNPFIDHPDLVNSIKDF